MLVALTVRKLRPGTAGEFTRRFSPPEGAAVPAGWKRFYAIRNLADADEVITFGFFEGTAEELRASQGEGGYDERRAAAEELVESIAADGIYEVVQERSMD